MATDKSPAFQFYPDAWLSSTDIMMMSPAEEGAYLRLLCHAWLATDKGLPDDDKALAVLSRLGSEWHAGSGEKIRRKFRAEGGRLFNDRQLEESRKQEDWSRKSSIGGKRSAAARARQRQPFSHPKTPSKGGSRVVAECLQPNANSSSSSSMVLRTIEGGAVPPLAGGNGRQAGETTDPAPSPAKPFQPYWRDDSGNLKPEFDGCREFTEDEIAEAERIFGGGR